MKQIKLFFATLAAYFAMAVGTIVFASRFSQKTYDNDLLLKASAAVAATANGSLILDIGSGLAEFDVVVDVTAIDANGDESYEIVLQGSPDATFGTAANIVALGSLTLGGATSARATATGQGAASSTGRYLFASRNELNGVTYRYLRIRTVVAGTAPGGITYLAFLAKR